MPFCFHNEFFHHSYKPKLAPPPDMDKTTRIKKLKDRIAMSKLTHENTLMSLSSLKEAHAYCVIHNISSQTFGPWLERFIQEKFGYTKNKAKDCSGDCSKNGENSEIKVSLGGSTHIKFNFVQIRPSHNCHNYILTAYHLSLENVEEEGELYIFKIPKDDMKVLVVSHGKYAHGTNKEHGLITIESLNDNENKKEYALRATIHDNCWNALLPFRIDENDL